MPWNQFSFSSIYIHETNTTGVKSKYSLKHIHNHSTYYLNIYNFLKFNNHCHIVSWFIQFKNKPMWSHRLFKNTACAWITKWLAKSITSSFTILHKNHTEQSTEEKADCFSVGKHIKTKIKGTFNWKGTHLHRKLSIIFWNCSRNTAHVPSPWIRHLPLLADGSQHETLRVTPYNLGIGVAASAMLSIAHSSVPLRMRKYPSSPQFVPQLFLTIQ